MGRGGSIGNELKVPDAELEEVTRHHGEDRWLGNRVPIAFPSLHRVHPHPAQVLRPHFEESTGADFRVTGVERVESGRDAFPFEDLDQGAGSNDCVAGRGGGGFG